MSCLIVQSQTLNLGLFDLNATLPTRFRALPHVVHENRAWAARFWIYTLKLTPHELLDHMVPDPEPRFTRPHYYPTYAFRSPPARRSQKPSPGGSVFDLYHKTHPRHELFDRTVPGPEPRFTQS